MMATNFNFFKHYIYFEARFAIKQLTVWLQPVLMMSLFIFLSSLILPYTVTSEIYLAGLIIWLNCLCALLITNDGLVRQEWTEGMWEQYSLWIQPLYVICLFKILWLSLFCFMAVLICIGLALMAFNLPFSYFIPMALGFGLALPMISTIGLISSLLMVTSQRGGGLLIMLALPLLVPVMLLGLIILEKAHFGEQYLPECALLLAISLIALLLGPFAASGAIKVSLSSGQ
jgi:heme exporter protein B